MYSMGMCFYEMLMGTIPFTEADIDRLVEIKLSLDISRKNKKLLKGLEDITLVLLKGMLHPIKEERISVETVVQMLILYFRQKKDEKLRK